MKLKKVELEMIAGCLNNLSNRDLPIWHELTANIRILRPHYLDYRENINDTIKKYSEKIENGKVDWGKNTKKAEEFISSLNSEVVDIDFTTIDLNTIKNISLPANAIEPLMDVIFVEAKVPVLEAEVV